MTPNNDTTVQTIPSGADTAQAVNHLEAFKAFVAKQDPEHHIDHVNGYKACAIGAYGKTVGVYDDIELCDLANDIISHAYETDGRYIAGVINVPAVARQIIPTYGELFAFLSDAEHSVIA